MSKTTLTIPAAYVAAVTDSVLMLYGTTAEAIHKTVAQSDDLADARLEMRARRWRLRQLGSLLDQLERPEAPDEDARSVRGEKTLIDQALHGVLCDHAEALGDACQRVLDGGGTDPLREHHQAVRAGADGRDNTNARHTGVAARGRRRIVHRVAERTGYTPEEIVASALEWHLQQHEDQPDTVSEKGA